MEEPTTLAGDSSLPKPLSQRGDIESSKIEAVTEVCLFYLSWDGPGLNKAFQGRRRPFFPIRPSPRGNFPVPLSTYYSMLIFGAHRLLETQ